MAGAFALLRLHVRQIIALDQIRRQIGADLHDDIGSGLAQIAILCEVAKREATPAGAGLLDEAANLARSMRDSMSDIVWAVDPHKERLADLVQRMRQAIFNLLEADGLRVEFQAPADQEIERINLAPDCRRQLLLIFKESLTNIARHGRASLVRVEMGLVAGQLQLMIRDNGDGFDPQAQFEGNGLGSIKRRAAQLQAQVEIISAPGHGTAIQMTLPLKKRWHR
jgi:signal transduction histidine kinase